MTSPISNFIYGPIGASFPYQQPQTSSQTPADLQGHSVSGGSFADILDLSPEAVAAMEGNMVAGSSLSADISYNNIDITKFEGIGIEQLTLNKAQQERVDALQKELDSIFGVAKTLSAAEQKEEKAILDEVTKLTGINSEGKTLTAEDKRKLEALHKQIGDVFADGKVTKDEEAKLEALFKRIDSMLGVSEQPKQLSDADQKKLAELYGKLDKLYGIKTPSEKDLTRVEEIFAEMDRIHSAAIAGSGQAEFDPLTKLSKGDRAQAEKLMKELDSIFGVNAEPKELSKVDQEKVANISKRIDEIYGIKHPTDTQMKEVDAIFAKIDKLFEDGKLTADEKKTLASLEKQLDGFFGSPKKKLTEVNQKELDKLFAQLDELHGFKTPSKSELARVGEIEKQLAALFGKDSTTV